MIGSTGSVPDAPFQNPFQVDGNYLKLENGRRYKVVILFPEGESQQYIDKADEMQKIAAQMYLMLLEAETLKSFEECKRAVFSEKSLSLDENEYKVKKNYKKLYDDLVAILLKVKIRSVAFEEEGKDRIRVVPVSSPSGAISDVATSVLR